MQDLADRLVRASGSIVLDWLEDQVLSDEFSKQESYRISPLLLSSHHDEEARRDFSCKVAPPSGGDGDS